MKLSGTIRKPICLILILACGFSLASCHGSSERESFDVPGSFDCERQTEITFWAKNDTNVTQRKIYEKAIADFEELYPNIKVNLRLYTDYGRIYNDVITNISTGTTPNVCITYPDHIATYMTGANVIVPLDKLIADEKYGLGGTELRFDSPAADEVIPKYLDECRINGSLCALPFMRSTEACYVNRSLVEKLGYELPGVLTWDFVWEVSEAAVKKNADGVYEANGQKTMIPFIYKSTDNMMIQLLRQKGAGYSDANGEIGIFNDVTRDLLYGIYGHAATGAFSTFKISSYPGNFLNAGQCVFAVDSTAGATWMGKASPHSDISPDKIVDYEIEVLPIPQFDPDHPVMISQGPSVCVFNKDDPQVVLASWLFAQFLLSNSVQIPYSQTEGYVPVTSRARTDPGYTDYLSRAGEDADLHYDVKIKAAMLLLDHVDDTFITPVFNGSASLRDAAGELIESVTKSARRKETVDAAYMDKLFDSVRSLYRLDSVSHAGMSDTGEDPGPLPAASVILLSGLALVWICIGAYLVYGAINKNGKRKKT